MGAMRTNYGQTTDVHGFVGRYIWISLGCHENYRVIK
jgi:hypothetical protein